VNQSEYERELSHLEREFREIETALAVEPNNPRLLERFAELVDKVRKLKQFTAEVESDSRDKIMPEQSPDRKQNDKKDILEGKLIHPALHIEPGFSSIGIFIDKDYLMLMSNGKIYTAKNLKGKLRVPPMYHPDIANRWRGKKIAFTDALSLLIRKWRELQRFENERTYPTFSLWAAGTYVFEAFLTFPHLAFTGEKGSGKSKAEDILQCVAFNALKLIVVTPAVLFRTIHSLRPTILIDEAETMNDDLRAIVNAGYKKGATVPRCQKDDYQPQFFEVYSPKCLASIQGLGDVTEDRCIVVVMAKPPHDDDRQNKSVDPSDPEWATIRDGFYQLPLYYSDRIIERHNGLSLPSWMRARDRELWSPLLTLASIADEEGNLGVFDDVLGFARELLEGKGLTFESEAILAQLEQWLAVSKQAAVRIHPGDLCSGLEAALNRRVTAEWVAGRLRSLGFKKDGRGARGVYYEVTMEKVLGIRSKHTA